MKPRWLFVLAPLLAAAVLRWVLPGERQPAEPPAADFFLLEQSRSVLHCLGQESGSQELPLDPEQLELFPEACRAPAEGAVSPARRGAAPRPVPPAAADAELPGKAMVELWECLYQDPPFSCLTAWSLAARSLAQDPGSLTALRVLALAAEVSGARRQATAAWRRLYAIERDEAWKREASEHLRGLAAPSEIEGFAAARRTGSPLARASRQLFDEWNEERLLASLGAPKEKVDAGSPQLTADLFERDLLAALDRLPPEERPWVAQAAARLRESVSLLNAYRAAEALPLLAEARAALAGRVEPLVLLADYRSALAGYYAGRRPQAAATAQGVFQAAYARRYFALAGLAGRLLSALQREQGFPELSLATLKRAYECFARLGHSGQLASTLSALAGAYQDLGESGKEWRSRLVALRLSSRFGDPARQPVVFGIAALAAAERGEYEAALALLAENAEGELRSGDPLAIAELLWWRGVIHQQGDRPDLGLRDVGQALAQAKAIGNEAARRNTLVGLYRLRGDLASRSDPPLALASLEEALRLAGALDLQYAAAELHLLRGRAARHAGDPALAERELLAALRELEEKRARIRDRDQRAGYFEKAQPVFEDLVELHLAAGRTAEALAYADLGRARELQAALGSDGAAPHGARRRPAELRRWLAQRPAGAPPIVFFEVRDGTTSAWVAKGKTLHCFDLGIDRRQLRRLVAATNAELAGAAQPVATPAAAAAYEALVAPWISLVGGASRILVVPDEELHRLPFHALADGATAQFLIEKTELVLSPSLAWTELRDSAPRAAPAAAPSFLAAEARQGPSGMDVPANVRLEMAAIERLYSRYAPLEPPTARQFARQAGGFEVVHFAGHATAGDSRRPPNLIFGPGDRLDVAAIRRLDLRRNRLVVLAACETNVAPSAVGLDGPATLATAFLSAGAHGVLATLRDVDDRETFHLMQRFHAHLSRGADPPAAFRAAVLELIHAEGAGPAVWAPFQLIGSFPAAPAARRGR